MPPLGPRVPHLLGAERAHVLVGASEHQFAPFDSLRGAQVRVDTGIDTVRRHPLGLSVDVAAPASAISAVVGFGAALLM